MSITQRPEPLQLPATLEAQLHAFRRRVWAIKMAEAAGIAVFAIVMAFLCVFALDRLLDTPRWVRLLVWFAALGGCAILPAHAYRWIWQLRGLEQLARVLTTKLPRLGDQLLGIIELVHDEGEQARSRTLCEAAVRCVAKDAEKYNFGAATPNSRHRTWGGLAACCVVAAVAIGIAFPSAVVNAWQRFLAPWAKTPRYTFAAVEPLPSEIIVPHGEPFQIAVRLAAGSLWKPREGSVQLDAQRPVLSPLHDGGYQFELPSQIAEGRLQLSIGDARQVVLIKPTLRPELTSIVAEVTLPAYLGQPKPVKQDVRGGSIALVRGSRARFTATASRKLSGASVDGQRQTPAAAAIESPLIKIDRPQKVRFQWQDEFGLAGKEPFTLSVTPCDDEAPQLVCEDLPRAKVVLDSEQLNFHVKAEDDFGVKEIGIEWQGLDKASVSKPAKGQRLIASGGFDKRTVAAVGTFSAQSLGIEPQPIRLRVFAVDYFPGRERVYSPNYILYILDAEQHAIWITQQLEKWHAQALEVRDREMQLYETNKQLRQLSPDKLDRPDTRRRIETQAAAEQANSRRLTGLALTGADSLREAARNPQFDVASLNRWAEMLQILKDIAGKRMPSVADLLEQAAKARAARASRLPRDQKLDKSAPAGALPAKRKPRI